MTSSPANTYYLCFPGKGEPQPWNPFEPGPKFYAGSVYFSGVLRAMEQHLDRAGLTFYLTPGLRHLPTYGSDVVAIVHGDESSRIPLYFNRIRATFKCYGVEQARPPSLLARPSVTNLMGHVQYFRDAARRLPGRLQYARQRQGRPSPIYPIPLGYANQLALPLKPFEERGVDVFFAGSVRHKTHPVWSAKRWVKTPKDLARTTMLEGLQQAQNDLPNLTVDLRLQSTFRRSIQASAADYSEGLMNARICLAPRGSSHETFRFFEAMRYGCITIIEDLPPHWFYEDAPAIRTAGWRDLPAILARLLDDRDRMRATHEATLAWWQSRCSETAMGRFIADKLNALD